MFSSAPVITELGKTLLLRAAGGEKFTFTKFQAGSGILGTDETPSSATALKNVVLSNISITRADDTEEQGYIQLTGSFNNQVDVQADFMWTELGLIAEDEEGNEYLYAYGYDSVYSEIIRAGGSSVITEQTVSVIIAIGDSGNVTAYILPNQTYALKNEFDELKEDVDDFMENPIPVDHGGTGGATVEDVWDNLQVVPTAPHEIPEEEQQVARENIGAVKFSSARVNVPRTGWQGAEAPYTCQVQVEIAKADNALLVGFGGATNVNVYEMITESALTCTGQGNGSITLTAFGEKPDMDFFVTVFAWEA